jgi:hypothetical protein
VSHAELPSVLAFGRIAALPREMATASACHACRARQTTLTVGPGFPQSLFLAQKQPWLVWIRGRLLVRIAIAAATPALASAFVDPFFLLILISPMPVYIQL